ncbi:MAG: hypothetical protein ACXVA2_08280 [Mucilaginibacter sp.]
MQNYYLKINYWRLLLSVFIFVLIAASSLFVVAAYEENGEGIEIMYQICKWAYILITFPNILFSKIILLESWWGLGFGLIAGCICYGILIEIAIIKYKQLKVRKPS